MIAMPRGFSTWLLLAHVVRGEEGHNSGSGNDDMLLLQKSLEVEEQATAPGLHKESLQSVLGIAQEQFPSSATGNLPSEVPPRPILFVKTHRTGGSTMTNIVQRVGDRERALFVLPADAQHLGWPGAFPGKENVQYNNLTRHQYDIITNHAVYNDGLMKAYLKPSPFIFTVLRNPVSQIQSALEHYQDNPSWAWGTNDTNRSSWDARLHFLADLQERPDKATALDLGRYQNPQAHDLGCHALQGDACNGDNEAMRGWISGIAGNISLAIMTEHFDEGLVLLRLKLGLELEDIVYLRMNAAGSTYGGFVRTPPTPSQENHLEEFLRGDIALYERCNRTFWAEWGLAGGDAVLGPELAQLKQEVQLLAEACGRGDSVRCTWRHRASARDYTAYLMERQKDLLAEREVEMEPTPVPTGKQGVIPSDSQANPSQRESHRRSLLNNRAPLPLSITLKHLAKAGGTYIQAVLEEVIPESLLTIRNETQSLVPEVTEGHFVLGSVRNPCEWYPSLWAHSMCEFCEWGESCYMKAFPEEQRRLVVPGHRDPPFNTPDDVQRFRAFMQNASADDVNVMSLRFWAGLVRLREEEGVHENMADRSTPKQYVDEEMSREERQTMLDELAAFDPYNSEVDCWIKVESMEEDLLACLQIYADQGGTVLWDKVHTSMASSTHYDSDHGDCQGFYDAETEALVRHGDATIFEKFGYTSCCVAQPVEVLGVADASPVPVADLNGGTQHGHWRQHGMGGNLESIEQVAKSSVEAVVAQEGKHSQAVHASSAQPALPLGALYATQKSNAGGHGEFVFVTGSEGSGTSMTARVLCQASHVLCIPTNWKLSQLSASAQDKYIRAGLEEWLDQDWMAVEHGEQQIDHGLGQQIVAFNFAILDLWHDAVARPYLLDGLDTRNEDERKRLLEAAAAATRQLLSAFQSANRKITRVVFHRSMPFAFPSDPKRAHTPFFHDLPEIARLIGPGWSAKSIFVVRDLPSTLLSNNDPSDYLPFVAQQEQLLTSGLEDLPMAWLSYSRIMCDPASAVGQLCRAFGPDDDDCDATLAESPEFDVRTSVSLADKHLDVEYVSEVTELRKAWNREKGLFPSFTQLMESGGSCCLNTRRWVLFAPLLAFAAFAFWVSLGPRPEQLRFKLQVLSYMDVFWIHLQYSAMIPIAYDLAIELGQGMTFSGFLIGAFWGAVACGCLLVARPIVSQATQSAQRAFALWGMLALVACNLAGVAGINPPPGWRLSFEGRTWLILGSRVFAGFAWSILTMVVSCMAVKVTPKADQVKNEGFRGFCITLGIGCGLLLTTADSVIPAGKGVVSYTRDQLAFPSWICCCVGVVVLLYAWCVIPDDGESLIDVSTGPEVDGLSSDSINSSPVVATGSTSNEMADSDNTSRGSAKEPAMKEKGQKELTATMAASIAEDRIWWNKLMYVLGCTYGIERALLTSSLESATSLVLETTFGWQPDLIGQTVGLIFVGAAFFIFFTVNIRPLLGDMVMLKWGSMTCFFSSGLLCYGITKAPSIIILADLLLFTAGFIASSVAEGKAMACATPGTFFSIENAWTIRNVLKCNLSRFVGPVLARYAIAADGGKLYAVSQLSLGVTAVALCCGIALVESRVGEIAKSANGLDAAKEARRQQGIAQTATGGTPFLLLSPRNRKKFRLGICGLGNVSQYYLENISKHLSDRFELVVGADPDASQRSKLGEGIATAKDLDGLLSHDLDCVVISAPTAAHFAVTSKAIAAGIPVLLEKPATTSMQELEELYELNGTGRPLHIAMHASFAQEVLWMAAHRDDFGALLDFDAWFFDPYVMDGKPTKHAQNLGGSWLDSGINAITCLRVAFGREVVVLGLDQETASGVHGSADVATTARAHIGNAEGTVRTDWRRGLNEKGIRLRFERASVSLQLTLQRVVVDGHVLEDFSASPRMLTRYGEVLKDFARALDTQTDNREFALSVHRSLFSTQNL